ncbi:hypothetical protein THAOC_19961 [Thalassiosira oceanica]|uniref:Uncharacterized protein n=1 Tax=Thalassiosira oceanica TaxID=159749 RepID=K0S3I6_THAOC|nr:hypothetical protein THAOC_19961 [Thalassiosira oceanica]|eukprot:EJK59775.1 hypothetical protein THAOC_19961 [Thalassiosira oceanica]
MVSRLAEFEGRGFVWPGGRSSYGFRALGVLAIQANLSNTPSPVTSTISSSASSSSTTRRQPRSYGKDASSPQSYVSYHVAPSYVAGYLIYFKRERKKKKRGERERRERREKKEEERGEEREEREGALWDPGGHYQTTKEGHEIVDPRGVDMRRNPAGSIID